MAFVENKVAGSFLQKRAIQHFDTILVQYMYFSSVLNDSMFSNVSD